MNTSEYESRAQGLLDAADERQRLYNEWTAGHVPNPIGPLMDAGIGLEAEATITWLRDRATWERAGQPERAKA